MKNDDHIRHFLAANTIKVWECFRCDSLNDVAFSRCMQCGADRPTEGDQKK